MLSTLSAGVDVFRTRDEPSAARARMLPWPTMRWLWVGCVAVGCSAGGADHPEGGGPAYATGVEDICFAETRSGAIERFPFMDKAQTLNSWLEERLADEAAHRLYFETILQASVLEQGDLLRSRATAVGLETCPLGGYLDFIGTLSSRAASNEGCARACLERNRATGEEQTIEAACVTGCGG